MRFADLRRAMSARRNSRAVDVSSFAHRDIFLYGAGNLGKKLKASLEEAGISVKGLIDRRAVALREQGVDALTLEEMAAVPKEESVVILSALFSLEDEPALREVLQTAGFPLVVALHELDWRSFDSASTSSSAIMTSSATSPATKRLSLRRMRFGRQRRSASST